MGCFAGPYITGPCGELITLQRHVRVVMVRPLDVVPVSAESGSTTLEQCVGEHNPPQYRVEFEQALFNQSC
jgi:hypothetical protein